MTHLVPSAEQIVATDPGASNWVGANAGSGKTHVLTQRVARLLLAGTEPQKILCLTYTKAAANEMQERLFRTLGTWSMEPEADLAARLGALSGGPPERDGAVLATARRLFARALETPGGLKIQTIHAFCETLLRRFPLEAGVSPRFEIADDRQSAGLVARVRVEMALAAERGEDDGFDRAAAVLNEGGIDALAVAVFARRRDFIGTDAEAALTAHFGAVTGRDAVAIAREALAALDPAALARLNAVLRAEGGKTEQGFADVLTAWLGPGGMAPDLAVKAMTGSILTKDGNPRKTGFPTKGVVTARPDAPEEIARLTDWALAARDGVLARGIVERTRDLYAFGTPLMARHDRAKAARGLLDFDDLIARTRALLTRPGTREWVLFKLDQGIDHILVDEAQDTAPLQWDVIAAIAEEFLAGAGARDEARSIFVVGDEKQSIYSFQGAEPAAFGAMREHFAGRLADLGTPLGAPKLITSYRSAPAILDFVDAVFEGAAAEGLTVTGAAVEHSAFRAQDQGRVDLWPLLEREDAPEPPGWWEPVDTPPATDSKLRLAGMVADEIARLVSGAHLPARMGPDGVVPGRRVRPGDILVLVQKRDRLAHGILRELKAREIPVAGADRLSLTRELAVMDLLALAKVAVMPGDDLSLAALLRSPLCDVAEEALFRLAHGRAGRLWDAVTASAEHAETAAFLDDMAGRADFLRPYEFLQRALIHHGGRRRLLARLGPEVEDPIDELLAQALAYETRETPTLAGFVHWIEDGDIQIKRQMDQGADRVRVMTVHGAKGLEAPIVILPDTVSGGGGGAGRPTLLTLDAGGNAPDLTVWAGASKGDDTVTAVAREAAKARDAAERKRLLYVALTRAEDWLILCGAAGRRAEKDGWYDLMAAGMDRLGAVEVASPTGTGVMRRYQSGPDAPPGQDPPQEAPPTAPGIPGWAAPAQVESKTARKRPSDLVPHGPDGGVGLGRAGALAKGLAVHALLETLPDLPLDAQADAARALLLRDHAGLAAHLRDAAVSEALAVLAMPDASDLFGPDSLSEITVAIDHGAAYRMTGRIDRLVVQATRVLIVDIKTDAVIPGTPEAVPKGYCAQLGAYRSAVMTGWPGKAVETAILWTAGPSLMDISADLCDRAFHSAAGMS